MSASLGPGQGEGGRPATVALVGATGFLGSHLLEALVRGGHRVIAGRRSGSSLDRVRGAASAVTWVDLDRDGLPALFSGERVDVAIDAATDYGRSGDAARLLETNVVLPVRLAAAAADAGVALFWHLDSFWNRDLPLDRQINLYAYSKSVAKQVLRLELSGRIQIFNLRLFHLFGPGDDARKFIPWVIDKLRRGEPLELTAGTQRIDLVSVREAVAMMRFLLERRAGFASPFEEFELGMGSALTLRAAVEHLKAALGSSSELRFGAVPMRRHEILDATADNARLLSAGYRLGTTALAELAALARGQWGLERAP